MNGQDGQKAAFVGDVFRAMHEALSEVAEAMPSKEKPGAGSEAARLERLSPRSRG